MTMNCEKDINVTITAGVQLASVNLVDSDTNCASYSVVSYNPDFFGNVSVVNKVLKFTPKQLGSSVLLVKGLCSGGWNPEFNVIVDVITGVVDLSAGASGGFSDITT